MSGTSDFSFDAENVIYEEPSPGIARITVDRPDRRNAQDMQVTYELNRAFDHAIQRDEVKVIILAATGPHFSSGHDLGSDRGKDRTDFPVVGTWGQFDSPGAEGRFGREMEIYYQITERWRNLSKPTIAQVQGKCITGGLALAWCCDLIVASEDAQFICTSPIMGGSGIEFWSYPLEVGHRRAKRWLMTGEPMCASDAFDFGMVSEVVPRAELEARTLELAGKIAQRTSWSLKMTKLAINNAQDVQGRRAAMDYGFLVHQLGHSHRMQVHGAPVDPNTLTPSLRDASMARWKGS
jgi:enoyl-CoA hydratase